jgi:hypothetical protein
MCNKTIRILKDGSECLKQVGAKQRTAEELLEMKWSGVSSGGDVETTTWIVKRNLECKDGKRVCWASGTGKNAYGRAGNVVQ